MEQRISIERMEQAVNLFGSFDENVRLIESEFSFGITTPMTLVRFVRSVCACFDGVYPVCAITRRIASFFSSLIYP